MNVSTLVKVKDSNSSTGSGDSNSGSSDSSTDNNESNNNGSNSGNKAQIIVAAVTQEVAMEALQVEIHQDQLVGLHQMLLKFIQVKMK